MKRAGILILVLVVIAVAVFQWLARGKGALPGGRDPRNTITVKGDTGGEKVGLLENAEIRQILLRKHGLVVEYRKLGSMEMVRDNPAGKDFLWPGSQIALDLYEERKAPLKKAEVLFNSPIVLYSWDRITAALEKAGMVQKTGETYYVRDFTRLIRLINEGKEWKDLGLDELYGRISIYSTDPVRSSSGNHFAALLANHLNEGQVVDRTSVTGVLPTLTRFFGRLGYLEDSSGDLFKQFLSLGMGSKPIIVGYESQLIEFSIENAQYRDQIKQRVRTLYPRPTVWSSHPLIALTDNGTKLLQALQDPDIQRIAWARHGFRSGFGLQNDPKALPVTGVPATVEHVMPLPQPQVMERIIEALRSR